MTRGLVLAVVLLDGGLGGGYWLGRPSSSSGAAVWSSGPTVTHLESLGDLVTTKVHVSDVLVANSEKHRGSWLIRGDALIAIDLSNAKISDADLENRTAAIWLPQPHVLAPRVDHSRTKTWDIATTTWKPWGRDQDESEMRDDAMLQAQKLIEFAAGSDENIAAARRNAVNVIEKVYKMVDWAVDVQWNSAAEK